MAQEPIGRTARRAILRRVSPRSRRQLLHTCAAHFLDVAPDPPRRLLCFRVAGERAVLSNGRSLPELLFNATPLRHNSVRNDLHWYVGASPVLPSSALLSFGLAAARVRCTDSHRRKRSLVLHPLSACHPPQPCPSPATALVCRRGLSLSPPRGHRHEEAAAAWGVDKHSFGGNLAALCRASFASLRATLCATHRVSPGADPGMRTALLLAALLALLLDALLALLLALGTRRGM